MANLRLDETAQDAAYAAKALQVSVNAVRAWRRDFRERALESIGMAGYSPREGLLSRAQVERLKAVFPQRSPRDTIKVRSRAAEGFGVEYSRRGACKPARRLVFAEPKHIPKVADEQSQRNFIGPCDRSVNGLLPTKSVVFAGAVHPEHRSRPAVGRFPKGSRPAVGATNGRRRLRHCGAFNLEEMRPARAEGERTDGEATLRLLWKIEAGSTHGGWVAPCTATLPETDGTAAFASSPTRYSLSSTKRFRPGRSR